VAITVTFNRPKTLERTLTHLINQEKLFKIIVVDNGAIFDVKKVIEKFKKYNPELMDVVALDQNTGGAGGFHFGMKYACENYDPDWYWIMDDDAYPRKNCLAKLLEAASKSGNNVGFLTPLIYGVGKSEFQLYHHKKLSKLLNREHSAVKNLHVITNLADQIILIEANAFVGPLISKEAVKQFGFPEKDLFIYGDDTEYTYRITRKMQGILVTSAIIDHEDVPQPSSTVVPYHWWKQYYAIRNRIFLIKKYGKIFQKQFGIFLMVLLVTKSMFATLLKKDYKYFRRIRLHLLLKALIDGLFNKYGKRLDPKDYVDLIKTKESERVN